MSAVTPSLLAETQGLLRCPACAGTLEMSGDSCGMHCRACQRPFPCEEGIPLLFWPTELEAEQDVTDVVKAFYEETPFPNYDDLDSRWHLREKARQGIFARLLDEQISPNANILEVGCGTGQLANFLGMTWGRTVFGADLCLNSLKLANRFKEENQISRVAFLQMNLFQPVFRPDSFDVVICNGVLHHTGAPFRGFQTIAKLVKPGGVIVVGLYHRWGRLRTDLRRAIFRVCSDRFQFLDPRLRDKTLNERRRLAWFMDQYKNPHESKHTFGEILDWFDRCNMQFLNSIPKAEAFTPFAPNEQLFHVHPPGTKFDHLIVQLGMFLAGDREGGFFIMIGRKPTVFSGQASSGATLGEPPAV